MPPTTDLPRLIGMVHLAALPGAPGFAGDLPGVIEAAVNDAATLEAAGFDALMVENFGDIPFFSDDVPKLTIASMTRAVGEIASATRVPVGVNVLRNDALGALAVAAASGASFIRVNVLSGMMFTDQGTIEGRAAEVGRLKASLGSDIAILADVFVKHSVPPAGLGVGQAAVDLAERAGADGVIVTGEGTGQAADISMLATVRKAIPGVPLYVGSGVTATNAAGLLETADGLIVGSSLKVGAVMTPVDPTKAREFIESVRGS